MKALENRTLDSKREMDLLSALDEMRSLRSRHERVGADAALAALKASAEREEGEGELELDAEDEEAVRCGRCGRRGGWAGGVVRWVPIDVWREPAGAEVSCWRALERGRCLRRAVFP